MAAATLDFALLDDLMLLRAAQAPSALPRLAAVVPESLGPALEYAFCRGPDSFLPPIEQLFPSPLTGVIATARFDGALPATSSITARDVELVRPPPRDRSTNVYWKAFRRRFVDAAKLAGFDDDDTAYGFVAAFGELVANVEEHSGAGDTALCGYRWTPGRFEFAVADQGRGVLDSLRSNPQYVRLHDHGRALHVALSSGESRFGHLVGRGTGFDTVFKSLARLAGSLRFRSGDHGLELTGTTPTLINARVSQRTHYQGFFASVACHT